MAEFSYAPTGWAYDKNNNLIFIQDEWDWRGKWNPYAPQGYTYTRNGMLKRNCSPRWNEKEMVLFEKEFPDY